MLHKKNKGKKPFYNWKYPDDETSISPSVWNAFKTSSKRFMPSQNKFIWLEIKHCNQCYINIRMFQLFSVSAYYISYVKWIYTSLQNGKIFFHIMGKFVCTIGFFFCHVLFKNYPFLPWTDMHYMHSTIIIGIQKNESCKKNKALNIFGCLDNKNHLVLLFSRYIVYCYKVFICFERNANKIVLNDN